MRVTLAVLFAIIIFIVSWLLNATVMAAVAFAATYAGVKPGIFLVINILMIWVLAPGLGSGVALYVASKKFRDVNSALILVGFVSVCVVFLVILFSFSLLIYSTQESSIWNIVLLVIQGGSILLGAKIGRNITEDTKI